MKYKSLVQVSREYKGLAEAGGIKEVTRAIAEQAFLSGLESMVIIPFYGFMNPLDGKWEQTDISYSIEIPGKQVDVIVFKTTMSSVTIIGLSFQEIFEKFGVYTYTERDHTLFPNANYGDGFYDTEEINVIFQKAVISFLIASKNIPDILHCHDAHCALIPSLIAEDKSIRRIFMHTAFLVTIHNAGPGYHQKMNDLNRAHALTGIDFNKLSRARIRDGVDPFALAGFDAFINTVSENYAKEILDPNNDEFTEGLSVFFHEAAIHVRGITNGIDPIHYDPRDGLESDSSIRFNPGELVPDGKVKLKNKLIDICKSKLEKNLKSFGVLAENPDFPLFTFHGRITEQKGVSVLVEAIYLLLKSRKDCMFIIMGQGNQYLEQKLIDLALSTQNVLFLKGYSESIAHMLFAGGDFFLIPSLFEPCGLTDYIAQLNGNIPIVHAVGGLVKVKNLETGFSYRENTCEAFAQVMSTAAALYRYLPEQLQVMRKRAFDEVFLYHTWETVFKSEYLPLYSELFTIKNSSY